MIQRSHRLHLAVSLGGLAPAAAAALASAAGLTARLVSIAPGRLAGTTRIDEVVELGVLAAGAAVAWWLAAGLATAAGCAGARALGRRWSAGERFVARHAPAIVRRGLALAAGAGLGLVSGVVPATAQSTDPPADIGWVATQVVTTPSPTTPPTPTPTPTASPATTPAVTTAAAAATPGTASTASTAQITVRPGDSLWKIAAAHLPAGATAADTAVAWPRLYETNRAVIGANPNVIRPGQVLTLPGGQS